MGGSLALWSATVAENIQAAVGFYPAVPWERMNPELAELRRQGRAASTASEEDGTSARARASRRRSRRSRRAGGSVEVYDYPGTHHAFFNDDRPEVLRRRGDRALAWDRTVTFLHEHLG